MCECAINDAVTKPIETGEGSAYMEWIWVRCEGTELLDSFFSKDNIVHMVTNVLGCEAFQSFGQHSQVQKLKGDLTSH